MSTPVNTAAFPQTSRPNTPVEANSTPLSEVDREVNMVSVGLIEQMESPDTHLHAQKQTFALFNPSFLNKHLSFEITYKGVRAPIAKQKMETLAATAKAYLESTYADLELRINNLTDLDRRSWDEDTALNQFKEQKYAFEHMQTYQFTRKFGGPALELTYENRSGQFKKITLLLNDDLNTEELTIDQYIADLEREVIELESIPTTSIDYDGSRLEELKRNQTIWQNPDNYQFDYSNNETTLMIVHPETREIFRRESLTRGPHARLAPVVSGQIVKLSNFYQAARESFKKVTQEDSDFAQESGFNDDMRIRRPEDERISEMMNR